MINIDYFKQQAKLLLKDYKTRYYTEEDDIYFYKPKYYNIIEMFLSYDIMDDDKNFKFSLMNAQHFIAKLSGFQNWSELLKASPTMLEIAKIRLNCWKVSGNPNLIDEFYEWYIPQYIEDNQVKLDEGTHLQLIKDFVEASK